MADEQSEQSEQPGLELGDAPRAKGPWFSVPAGRVAEACRSCRQVVYWIRTDAGLMMPVDCSVAGAFTPTPTEPGEGVSHFATCPQRDQWRKRKAGGRR